MVVVFLEVRVSQSHKSNKLIDFKLVFTSVYTFSVNLVFARMAECCRRRRRRRRLFYFGVCSSPAFTAKYLVNYTI